MATMDKKKRKSSADLLAQLSSRGQITLPADVRRAVGLEPGDPLWIRVEAGRIVLEPVVVVPVERYTEERIREFAQEAEMSPQVLEAARKRWGLS